MEVLLTSSHCWSEDQSNGTMLYPWNADEDGVDGYQMIDDCVKTPHEWQRCLACYQCFRSYDR